MRIPKLRPHATGQARVEYKGKTLYFGPWGSQEANERYREWVRRLVTPHEEPPVTAPGRPITVARLLCSFLDHAKRYYSAGEYGMLTTAVAPVSKMFGGMLARDFGPKALRAVRNKMIKLDWSRNHINQQIGRVRRVFKWGVEHELIPSSVLHSIAAVAPLKKNRSEARETAKKTGVPWEHVEPVLPYLSPDVAAMVRLQWLTGMRSNELCIMRRDRIDQSEDVWIYRPTKHKTEWREGHEVKEIAIGPQAQEVLTPFLSRSGYLFRPQAVVSGTGRKRRAMFTASTYRKAVVDGIKKLSRARRKENEDAEPAPHWHPHQLRHSRGTLLRKLYGVEASKVSLGHASLDATLIYAASDAELAIKIARETG